MTVRIFSFVFNLLSWSGATMKTYLECVPCFFQQALETAKRSGCTRKQQKEVMYKLAKKFCTIDLFKSPPENAHHVYDMVKKVSGQKDPYKKEKQKANEFALKVYPGIKKRLQKSSDKLFQAVELAIAGNIIDFGTKKNVNAQKEIEKIIKKETQVIKKQKSKLFRFEGFEKALKKAKNIVVLGDNAGEIVFDRILIETILELYPDKEIIYAVKEKPIINDVLKADAKMVGLDKIVKVVSSGISRPGTVVRLCSKTFQKILKNTDMIISKGQGNYEALSEERGYPVFFLFMAKCDIICQHVGCELNSILLLKS
jgi:uncharacterized protein with ATP-grasp and redox domains